MSQLSALAKRVVEKAVTSYEEQQQRDAWDSWINYCDTEFPTYVAQIATHALNCMAKEIKNKIDNGCIDSKLAAQLENDLGYISDIEAFFAESIYDSTVAYA